MFSAAHYRFVRTILQRGLVAKPDLVPEATYRFSPKPSFYFIIRVNRLDSSRKVRSEEKGRNTECAEGRGEHRVESEIGGWGIGAPDKKERRSVESQAPLPTAQSKFPIPQGSPPSRQERRCPKYKIIYPDLQRWSNALNVAFLKANKGRIC